MIVNQTYTKGSVWWAKLPRWGESSVQCGFRPVVIVSSEIGCLSCGVVMVCPMTTKLKDLSVNAIIDFDIDGRSQAVITNQVMTLPKDILYSYQGELNRKDLVKVEKGLRTSLGLEPEVTLDPEAKANREALDKLIPEAKELVSKLNEIISQREPTSQAVESIKKTRVIIKRSQEEVANFIKDWEDPGNNKNMIAEVYKFNSYNSAWQFYKSHKNKFKR
jgi:mRNA-degrading endonuclease toxin of MazEF toxin-antitoxin module